MIFLAAYARRRYGMKFLRRLPGLPIELALYGDRELLNAWARRQRRNGAAPTAREIHLPSEMRRVV
jgi:hypothetical protein